MRKLNIFLFSLFLCCFCLFTVLAADQISTQYVLKPSIQEGLAVAQSVAPFFGPYSDAVTGGLSLLGMILAAYARRRSVQLKRSNYTLAAVVAGVEAATEALKPGDASNVKRIVRNQALQDGVQEHLHSVVQTVTKDAP